MRLSRIHAVEQEAAERGEPSDGLRIALRSPPKRSLDGERMKSVPILGKLKPRLRFLCFLLFFTELLRLSGRTRSPNPWLSPRFACRAWPADQLRRAQVRDLEVRAKLSVFAFFVFAADSPELPAINA